MTDMFMVGYDNSHGDIPVLTVGKLLPNHQVDIVNIFKDQEAIKLYEKLTEPTTLNTK